MSINWHRPKRSEFNDKYYLLTCRKSREERNNKEKRADTENRKGKAVMWERIHNMTAFYDN